MEYAVYRQLIEQIPYEKKLSDFDLKSDQKPERPSEYQPKVIQEQTPKKGTSLKDELMSQDVCIISVVPIDRRYLACRFILGKKN